MRPFSIFLLAAIFIWAGCKRHTDNFEAVLPSPGNDVHLHFNLFNGIPYYLVYFDENKIISWSLMGFMPPEGPALNEKMLIGDRNMNLPEETGSEAGFFTGLKFNTLSVSLASETDPDLGYTIDFRTFQDGFAFRYRFESPEDKTKLMHYESTEFVFVNEMHNWRLLNVPDAPGREPGLIGFPAEILSDQRLVLKIMDLESDTTAGIKLNPAEDFTSFSVVAGEGLMNEANPVENTVTPWRIVIISNELADE